MGLEVLVIDSGSRDHSVDIARAAGVSVLEIEPPVPECLAADRESHALSDRVCAVFGAHLPPAETSPMIARELTEFFAGFPDGLDDSAFLSKVNASYKRAC